MSNLFIKLSAPSREGETIYCFRVASVVGGGTSYYAPHGKDYVSDFFSDLTKWRSETAYLSNPQKITEHECFKRLVKNAPITTELIIMELRKEPSLLCWVLSSAFDMQPYGPDDVGDVTAMADSWISWYDRQKSNRNVAAPLIGQSGSARYASI